MVSRRCAPGGCQSVPIRRRGSAEALPVLILCSARALFSLAGEGTLAGWGLATSGVCFLVCWSVTLRRVCHEVQSDSHADRGGIHRDGRHGGRARQHLLLLRSSLSAGPAQRRRRATGSGAGAWRKEWGPGFAGDPSSPIRRRGLGALLRDLRRLAERQGNAGTTNGLDRHVRAVARRRGATT